MKSHLMPLLWVGALENRQIVDGVAGEGYAKRS